MEIRPEQILILIPVYNRQKYFEIFIKYFKSSDAFNSVDYLIVDDCSTEFDIFEMAGQYDIPASNVIKNQVNLGINYAFINLIEIAREVNMPYVMILDPDSIVHPRFIEFIIETTRWMGKDFSDNMLSIFCRLKSSSNFWKNGLAKNCEWPISNGGISSLRLQERIAEKCLKYSLQDDHFYNWEKAMTDVFNSGEYTYYEPLKEGYLFHFGKVSSANFCHRFLSSKSTGIIGKAFEQQIKKELKIKSLKDLFFVESDTQCSENRPFHSDVRIGPASE